MYYKLNIEDFVMTALSCVVKRDCKLFICKGVVMGGILSLNIDCKLKSSFNSKCFNFIIKGRTFCRIKVLSDWTTFANNSFFGQRWKCNVIVVVKSRKKGKANLLVLAIIKRCYDGMS